VRRIGSECERKRETERARASERGREGKEACGRANERDPRELLGNPGRALHGGDGRTNWGRVITTMRPISAQFRPVSKSRRMTQSKEAVVFTAGTTLVALSGPRSILHDEGTQTDTERIWLERGWWATSVHQELGQYIPDLSFSLCFCHLPGTPLTAIMMTTHTHTHTHEM
jgi:hypothetical protein